MTAARESAERIAIVCDRDGKWYVRRIKLVTLDLDANEKVYRCDRHISGPHDALEQVPAIEAALTAARAEATAEERERCAKVAETFQPVGHDYPARGHEIASAIRGGEGAD